MKKLSLIALLAGLTMTAGAAVSVAPTYVNQPIVVQAETPVADPVADAKAAAVAALTANPYHTADMLAAFDHADVDTVDEVNALLAQYEAECLATGQAKTLDTFNALKEDMMLALENRLSAGGQANIALKMVAIEAAINATTSMATLWDVTKSKTSEYILYVFEQAYITDFFKQTEFLNNLVALNAHDLTGLANLWSATLDETIDRANAGYQAMLETKKFDTLKAFATAYGFGSIDKATVSEYAAAMKACIAQGAEWTEAMIVRITNATTLEEVDAMYNLAIAEINDARNQAAAALKAAKAQAILALETQYGASYVTGAMKSAINGAANLDAVALAKLTIEEEIKATIAGEKAEAALAAAKAQAIATLNTVYPGYVTTAMEDAINGAANLDAVALAKLTVEEEIKAIIAGEKAEAALAAAKAQAIATLNTVYPGYLTVAMEDAINSAADLDAVAIAKIAVEKEIKAIIAGEEAEAALADAKAQALATLNTVYPGYVTTVMEDAINGAADLDAVALAKVAVEEEIKAIIDGEIAEAKAAALRSAKEAAKDALKLYAAYDEATMGARIDLATSVEQVESIRAALETDIKNSMAIAALESEIAQLIADTNTKINAMQNAVNANIDGMEALLEQRVTELQGKLADLKKQINDSAETMTSTMKADLENKVNALQGELTDVERTLTNEIHKKERPIEVKQWVSIIGSIAVIVMQAIMILVILIKRNNMMAVEMARLEKEIERKKKEKKGVACNKCGVRLSVKPDGNNTYICPVCSNQFRVQKKLKK